jgi:hypothetical protein
MKRVKKKSKRRMVNTSSAAEQLGTSQYHIRRLIEQGRLDGEQQDDGTWKVVVRSVSQYQKDRRPAGRPLDTLSEEPANIKQYGEGTPKAERRREYLRIKQRESRERRRAAGKI